MRLIRQIILCSLLLAHVVALRAQEGTVDPGLTTPERQMPYLAEAMDVALKQSPQMLLRSIELSKADASRIVSDSARWPTLGMNSSYGVSTVSSTGSESSTSNGFTYSLNFVQPVFRWGDVRAGVEIGVLQQKIAQKSYAEGYRDLVVFLRGKFFELIVKKYDVQSRRLDLENVRRTHAMNTEKQKTGNISPGAYDASALTLEEAQFNLDRSESDYAQMKRAFARLTGLKEVAEERIPDTIQAPHVVENQATRLAAFFDQNDGARNTPTALQNQYQIRQSELRYRMARTRQLPKFDFKMGVLQQNVTKFEGGAVGQSVTNQKSVAVEANWNIFDGFATRGEKRNALAGQRSAEMQLNTYLTGLDEQKRNQVTQFNLSLRGLQMAEHRLNMAKGSYGHAEGEAKQGRLSLDSLGELKASARRYERDALLARADVYLRWSDLLSTLWMDPALKNLPPSYLNHGK